MTQRVRLVTRVATEDLDAPGVITGGQGTGATTVVTLTDTSIKITKTFIWNATTPTLLSWSRLVEDLP